MDGQENSTCYREGKVQGHAIRTLSLKCRPSSPSMAHHVLPRKTYHKTTTEGITVTSEITVPDGWRRHTRVYGGGVCEACQENDKRLTARLYGRKVEQELEHAAPSKNHGNSEGVKGREDRGPGTREGCGNATEIL